MTDLPLMKIIARSLLGRGSYWLSGSRSHISGPMAARCVCGLGILIITLANSLLPVTSVTHFRP